ncbi:MAG: hypothetical protein MZV70_51020 [Desulfobacterales bacterium]|nr:hypothetical protein [Desulfobacterales bacterium]
MGMEEALIRVPSRSTNPKDVFVPPISIPSTRSFSSHRNLPTINIYGLLEIDRHGKKSFSGFGLFFEIIFITGLS